MQPYLGEGFSESIKFKLNGSRYNTFGCHYILRMFKNYWAHLRYTIRSTGGAGGAAVGSGRWIRRFEEEDGILELLCYLFFRQAPKGRN
jgi:hypothetical protein